MVINRINLKNILSKQPKIFLCILGCYILSGLRSPIYAEGISLGVYPPILTIKAVPPANIVSSIKVKNFTDSPEEVKIELTPFKNGPENNGEIVFTNPTSIYRLLFSNVQIYDQDKIVSNVLLSPNEEKNLGLHIDLPKDFNASDYYFSILFITKNINALPISSGVNIQAGAGVNVILAVGPTKGTPAGLIKEFSSPTFLQHGPVPFTVLVQNLSSTFIQPKGSIAIQNMLGQTVGTVRLFPEDILKDSPRFISGENNPNDIHAMWDKQFLIGAYKAKLTVTLSDQGPLLSTTMYFFALPADTIIVCLLGCVIIFLIARRILRRLK